MTLEQRLDDGRVQVGACDKAGRQRRCVVRTAAHASAHERGQHQHGQFLLRAEEGDRLLGCQFLAEASQLVATVARTRHVISEALRPFFAGVRVCEEQQLAKSLAFSLSILELGDRPAIAVAVLGGRLVAVVPCEDAHIDIAAGHIAKAQVQRALIGRGVALHPRHLEAGLLQCAEYRLSMPLQVFKGRREVDTQWLHAPFTLPRLGLLL